MTHLTPLAALAAVALALPVTAQQRPDPSRLFPITTPIRNAGTVDVTTGRWTRPAQGTKSTGNVIFNNTCTWTTQAYYDGQDWCQELYDEGRIPSPSDPNAPIGAQVDNTISSIQVSYCTFAGPLQPSGYDMDLAFFDKLGGDCAGYTPPTPPPVSSTATAYIPLAGLGLPGSTTFGFQACWVVTLDVSNSGMVLASDGDGTFDGVGADDTFLWMQRQNTTVGPLAIPGLPDGFFISGEPATGGYGACSYNIPCGIDAFWGNTCGTGLDSFDASWINIDGVGVGSSNIPLGCYNAYLGMVGSGTGCYSYGGYPSNPFTSHWLILERSNDECFAVYCSQTKPTSVAGCTASLTVTDCSLATGVWSATDIPAAAPSTIVGIYIYTDGLGIGPSAVNVSVPFGTLCLSGFKRSSPACAPAVLAGSAGCNTGTMDVAVGCNAGALGIAAGEDVNVQLWHRDPTAPGTANFSNAIFYTVQ